MTVKSFIRFDPVLSPELTRTLDWLQKEDIHNIQREGFILQSLGKMETRAQSYKTLYGRNLRIFVIS
jgi:hypothetical protein